MFKLDSFRNRLIILFAGLSFTLGLCTTVYIGIKASEQMTEASGETLHVMGKSISNIFANSLEEREREIVLLGQSPFFQETALKDPRLLLKLNQVKDSYPYYAWLGIASPDGKVAIAADDMLQGEDVSERPWFKGGLKKTYLGDVHGAVLLAKKIQPMVEGEPLRFIDFSTPLYDTNNKLKGVLATHVDWSWATHTLQAALPQNAAAKGIEIFIVNAKGEMLYPYKSIGEVTVPLASTQESMFFIDDWNEGKKYFTVNIPIVAKTEMSLGWHIIIRQPAAVVLADVRTLQLQIVLLGLLISLLMLWLTYKLANRFSQPIENLARTAEEVERGKVQVNFEQETSIVEIKALSASLTSMTNKLLSQSQQLQDVNLNLEKKVFERTQELHAANIELEKLARHDALTGLHNRHALNIHLGFLFEQFKRTQHAYSVLMIDIDFFKKINDQHGHEVGDYVLQSVAKILSDLLRTTDFCARLGGEEFIVILPATDVQGAKKLAEKIRLAISQATILEYPVTVSIGVALVNEHDEDMQVAVRRADVHLYHAKEQGRNRVMAEA